MAIRNKNSVNEVLRNSIGGVTYSDCNGLSIVKTKIQVNSSNTPAQQRQRKRWPEYSNLADAFWDAICIGFPGRRQTHSPFNAFVHANKDVVTVDESLKVTIDYEKVVCSIGRLTAPAVSVTVNQETRMLNFTVQNTSSYGRRSLGSDKVYAQVVERTRLEGFLAPIGTREEAAVTEIGFPAEWDAENLAVYVFATTDDGRKVSKSTYLNVGTV